MAVNKAGVSLVALKTNFGQAPELNYSTTINGANALLIVVTGSNATKINKPTASSGSVSDATRLEFYSSDQDGRYIYSGNIYVVTGISGNCTVNFSSTTWDWGWGVWIYKIA